MVRGRRATQESMGGGGWGDVTGKLKLQQQLNLHILIYKNIGQILECLYIYMQ